MEAGSDKGVLERVAARALEEVRAGMRLGLGTGRASEGFIRLLGERCRAGLAVTGVPTSARSERLAREVGVPVEPLDPRPLDVAFDGADEVAPDGALTKGLGGAMLRERVVAVHAGRFVVLVTPEKLVERLGTRSPLPVEVVPFAADVVLAKLAAAHPGAAFRLREDGARFLTDNENPVIHVPAPEGGWTDAPRTDRAVRALPGVVDTGFFFGLASLIVIGHADRVETRS